jgi:hypothetical protein
LHHDLDVFRCEFAPFDPEAVTDFPYDMGCDYRIASRRLWQRNAHLNERMKTQIAIGPHEGAAQTKILQASICRREGGRLKAYRYIHPGSRTPAVLETIWSI